MTDRYLKKYWTVPDEQPVGRVNPTGVLTHELEPLNTFEITVTDLEYFKVLSALKLGAEIAYPDEWGALLDIWLSLPDPSEFYVGDGTYYRMDAPFIKWYPGNPFLKNSNLIPQGQLFPAWFVYSLEFPEFVTDFLEFFGIEWDTFLGYQVGDVISTILNMRVGNLTGLITDWLFGNESESFVKTGFEIHVNGEGTMALEVLNVPQGGRVLWQIDEPITILDTVLLQSIFDRDDDLLETDLDIVSIPPEQDVEDVEEIVITGTGNHIVYVQLLPVVNDQLIPIAYGSGFRSIRLGNGLQPVDPETGEIFTPDKLLTPTSDLGLVTMTYSDLRRAVRDGTLDVYALALQSGIGENVRDDIVIDAETGDRVIKQHSQSANEAIDGTTQEVHFGGVSNQAFRFKELFDGINGQITTGYAVSTISNLSKLIVNPFDPAAWLALITDYQGLDPQIEIDADELSLHLYCASYETGVLAYALAEHSASEDDVNAIAEFASGIPQSTWQKWYDEGALIPRLGFTSADCYTLEAQTIEYTAAQFLAVIGSTSLSSSPFYITTLQSQRLKRAKITGSILDSEGRKFDGVYYVNDVGTILYTTPKLLNSASGLYSPTSQPSYKSSGGYSVEFNQTHNTLYISGFAALFTEDTWRTQFVPPLTGKLIVTLIDVGPNS